MGSSGWVYKSPRKIRTESNQFGVKIFTVSAAPGIINDTIAAYHPGILQLPGASCQELYSNGRIRQCYRIRLNGGVGFGNGNGVVMGGGLCTRSESRLKPQKDDKGNEKGDRHAENTCHRY